MRDLVERDRNLIFAFVTTVASAFLGGLQFGRVLSGKAEFLQPVTFTFIILFGFGVWYFLSALNASKEELEEGDR